MSSTAGSGLDVALTRLRRILPLAERRARCGEPARRLHHDILHGFAERGRVPTRREMAALVDDPAAALAELSAAELVLLDGEGQPRGAYPFIAEPREHRLRVNGHRVHAMCALDALAVAPMFEVPVDIASRCRITGDPVAIRQSGMRVENLPEAGGIRLGIDWGAADSGACCADSLCLQMLFLRDDEIARQWAADAPQTREVFTLLDAVELASRFFVPLVS